jgi:hypothetical protein
MAETETGDFQSRIEALEKSITDLRRTITRGQGRITEIHADAITTRENSVRALEMLQEVLPLVRRAAPLLDSPLAKMANSPAASVLGLFGGGRRG